ncbi:MAG: RodZ domain-containing protein [Gammaproteobacteria bacterium]
MLETGSDTRSGIGARLRAGREKTGLTLLQVAEKLHVDAKVIESLEGEHFDALGAPVFVRGHLRHYADLIGEQSAQLLELYTGGNKPVMPDLTRLPKAAPETRPSRLAVPALVVLIGFVLLGVVWWLVQSIGGKGETKHASAQAVAIEPEVASDPAAAEDAVDDSNRVGAPVNAAPTGGAAAGGTSAVGNSGVGRPGVSGDAKGAATAASSSNGATPFGSGPKGTVPAATPAPVRGKPMEVTLKFAADSWVEIYDANGEKLFYDIGPAESSRTISGTPPFRVTFGNAPGVTFDVDGKPAAVPASALKDDAAQFVINRSGRVVKARAPAGGG